MGRTFDLILKELQQVSIRLQPFEQTTKENFNNLNQKVDKLSEKIAVQHIENINADNLLLDEIRSIREGVVCES